MPKLLKLINGPFLDSCYLRLKQMPPKEERPKLIEGQLSAIIGISPDLKKTYISLTSKSESLGIPFDFEVTMKAVFDLSGGHKDDDETRKKILEDGYPIVFPVLKDFIAELTRKTGNRPFNLPEQEFELNGINFEEITTAKTTKKKLTGKPSKKAPPKK